MASKKALRFLRDNGIDVRHNRTENRNFATGRGIGKFALPFHIVAIDSRNGTAKRTVGWEADLNTALDVRDRMQRADNERIDRSTGRGGAEYHANRVTYYVMDIRTNETVFRPYANRKTRKF